MMMFIAFVLGVLLGIHGASADPIQVSYPPPPPPYDIIVEVDVGTGHGSGFILDDHRVVTAAHVADGTEPVTIVLSNGVRRPGEVVAFDKGADVAIIRTSRSLDRRALLTCGTTPVGEEVHAGAEFVSGSGHLPLP